MEEVFQMYFCLVRNGYKGWENGRGLGRLNKGVGVESREGHWRDVD